MLLALLLLTQSYDELLAEGGKAYEAGRYAEAAALFTKAAEKKPTPEAWTALGHAKAALKRAADSLREIDRLRAGRGCGGGLAPQGRHPELSRTRARKR